MNYQFNTSIETTISTWCLIENYQDLITAKVKGDWDLVQTVRDCLAITICESTDSLKGLDIIPSPSSLIAPSCCPGIILDENGGDIRCAAYIGVSKIMYNGCCQCDKDCIALHGCDPDNGKVRLACGFVFDMADKSPQRDEALLAALEKTMVAPVII